MILDRPTRHLLDWLDRFHFFVQHDKTFLTSRAAYGFSVVVLRQWGGRSTDVHPEASERA